MSFKDTAARFQEEKKKISDNIKADLEVHVKYGGEWFVAMKKEDVVMSHLPHGIDLLSRNIQRSMEKILYEFNAQDFKNMNEGEFEMDDDGEKIVFLPKELNDDGEIGT